MGAGATEGGADLALSRWSGTTLVLATFHACLVILSLTAFYANRDNWPRINDATLARPTSASVVTHRDIAATLSFSLPGELVRGKTNVVKCHLVNPSGHLMDQGELLTRHRFEIALIDDEGSARKVPATKFLDFYHYVWEATVTSFDVRFVVPPETPERLRIRASLVDVRDGVAVLEATAASKARDESLGFMDLLDSQDFRHELYLRMRGVLVAMAAAHACALVVAVVVSRRSLHEVLAWTLFCPAAGFVVSSGFGYCAYYRWGLAKPVSFLFGMLTLAAIPVATLAVAIFRARRAGPPVEPAVSVDEGVWPARVVAVTGLVILALVHVMNAGLFEWDYFCERDYARALLAVDGVRFDVLGPQLLTGGRLPGFMVNALFYGPLKLWRDPGALAILCKALAIGGVVLSWRLLAPRFGRLTAAATAFLMVANVCYYGYSVWPIHPSFTPFFGVLFFHSFHRWAVEQRPWALVGMSAWYSVLIQLHMSYFLLAISVGLVWIALRPPAPWRVVLAAVGVGILFVVPYFVHEARTGFLNTREILILPRFQPDFVAREGIINQFIFTRMLLCFVAYDGYEHVKWFEVAWMLLTPLGLARFTLDLRGGGEKARRAFFILAYYAGMTIFYSAYGRWMENRYFLVLAPVLFLCQAAGLEWMGEAAARATKRPAARWLFVGAALIALAVARVPQLLSYGEPGHRFIGDWTMPYAESREITKTLIRKYGVDPEMFRDRVYVFMRWPMPGPETFDAWFAEETRREGPPPPPNMGYLVVWHNCKVPDYFIANPNIILGERSVEPLFTLVRYTTRNGRLYTDTRNGNIPTPAEDEVERFAQEHIRSRVEVRSQNARGFYILPGTHLFASHTVEVTPTASGGARLASRIESPSLSGYYNEIKTVRRPYVEIRDRAGAVLARHVVLEEILGGTLVKTPVTSVFEVPALPEDAVVHVGVEGWYDRAFMSDPSFEPFDLPLFRWQGGRALPLEPRQ